MPDWLVYDKRFLLELDECVQAWLPRRSLGLQALEEFADVAQATAKEILDTSVGEAITAEHRYDITMVVYIYIYIYWLAQVPPNLGAIIKP